MIFPKDKGGNWKNGHNFEMGRAPFLEKCFLKNFLGQENAKKTHAFPSCNHVSPSPHVLDYVERFGKGDLAFTQEAKTALSLDP